MRRQGMFVLGVVLIVLGVLGVLGSVLHIRFGAYFWPLFLVAIGAWMILRPRMVEEGVTVTQKVLGDVRRDGAWQVVPEDISMAAGDAKLDYSQAVFPDGETSLTVVHVLGDVRLTLPQDVGLDLESTSLIADVKVFGQKHEGFATPVHVVSDGYAEAARKFKLRVYNLLGNVRVERA